MKSPILTLALSLGLSFGGLVSAEDQPVDYVNPLVGTQSTYELSTGNTYPAIALPWGMNFWTPQTGKMGNGWAYVYTENKIRGFKQTHQPSPWNNDYGQFSLMPVTGKPVFDEDERASWFSHMAEVAKPYYYQTFLAEHDVLTEITPTERSAFFRFTYPEGSSYLVVDAFDKGSYIKLIPEENKIIGYTTKNSGGVPDNFKNYFVIVFDQPYTYQSVVDQGNLSEQKLEIQSDHAGAIIGFKTKKGQQVQARVASSFISFEQAELNLQEIGSDSFETVKERGRERWNEVLSRIEIDDPSIDNKRTFYSCLYRSLLFPRDFSEFNAEGERIHYSPYNGKVLPGNMFTDTGFWDTFRSLFPFLNLMYPDVAVRMQEGLVNAYNESGFLPEWASPGHRVSMIGNNSASVVADAYIKGLKGYDVETLWEAVIHGANNVHPVVKQTGREGYELYNKYGFIPSDQKINQTAARTLEYAFSDWSIYQFGKALGKPDSEIKIYAQRAMNYKNLFDPEHKLMRGKKADGTFVSPFKPTDWSRDFTEGNSWHYSWAVLHDPKGLATLMGGDEAFTQMLDSVFKIPSSEGMDSRSMIHEMREMQVMNMGQYAHGNQPIQHMAYLFNYSKAPWRSQYWAREIMERLYHANPDGYCGDEDNGQTSAWYVFSALGFYTVCPGSDQYAIGSPLFRKVTLNFPSGKKTVLEAQNNSSRNRYIQAIELNGKAWSANYFSHENLLKGGTIRYNMGSEPNKSRGTSEADRPYSFSDEF